MLFRNFAASFPKACKEYDNMDNKDNKKKKGGKHPATADGHKPNWREVYATVEEIEAFLSNHMYLRRNLVKGRVEYKLPTPLPLPNGRGVQSLLSPDCIQSPHPFGRGRGWVFGCVLGLGLPPSPSPRYGAGRSYPSESSGYPPPSPCTPSSSSSSAPFPLPQLYFSSAIHF